MLDCLKLCLIFGKSCAIKKRTNNFYHKVKSVATTVYFLAAAGKTYSSNWSQRNNSLFLDLKIKVPLFLYNLVLLVNSKRSGRILAMAYENWSRRLTLICIYPYTHIINATSCTCVYFSDLKKENLVMVSSCTELSISPDLLVNFEKFFGEWIFCN